MHPWTRNFFGSSLATLAVSAAGVAVAAHCNDGAMAGAAASFATNVLGGFGVDALKRCYRHCVERPGRPTDENHVILRNLRAAQLQALSEVAQRFDRSRRDDSDRARAERADLFSGLLHAYVTREQSRIPTLSAADLAEPTEGDAERLRAALIARAPDDFDAGLSARHGAGPALGTFRRAAEAAMLAEVRAFVFDEIPPAFDSLLRGGPDGSDGWFALFIRDAARRLREDAAFERIWQAEQTAAFRELIRRMGDDVAALQAATGNLASGLAVFGRQLDEIAGEAREARTVLDAIAARLDDVRGWLYFNAAFEAKGWLRFHAFNRAIPFQGREGELAALYAFLNHADPFRWWIVTAPGGSGKTRLALELCLRAHLDGWQVGYLQKPFTPVAVAWSPRVPTLIVADYAAEQVSAIHGLALALAQRPRAEQPVVRLLMLERQVDDVFWQRFLGSYGGDSGALGATRHAERPLALPDLSEDEVWQLVQPCPWRDDGRGVTTARTVFFTHLAEIDRPRRALVAMLLADAVATSDQPSFATLDAVLHALVQRARDHHWPAELEAKQRPLGSALPADVLIAAATMAGHVGEPEIRLIEDRLGLRITGAMLDACARAIGSPLHPTTRRLDGIQPDLIGEYFALTAIARDPRDLPPVPELAAWAWRADEIAMAAFVARARQNFPGHRALAEIEVTVPGQAESWWTAVLPLIETAAADPLEGLTAAQARLAGAATADAGAATALSRLCWLSTGLDRVLLPFHVVDAWVRALLDVPAAFRRDPRLRAGLGASLFNTLNHAKAEDALDRRDALLDALRALAADHPDDAAVRENLAMGLYNTLNDAKAEDALDRRDALLDALRALAADHPDDAAMREKLAMGLFATLNHAKAEDALDRRDALLDALRALAADHPDDAAVREKLAMGLYNTLNHAKAEDALDRRDALLDALLDALRALAADHPDDAAVRENLAMGLLNTLNDAKAEDALDRRDALLDALRALAADHPDDAAVRENLAMGLYNTLNDAKAEDALDRRDALLDALRALAADHPDDAAMRENLAMGLFNTLNDAKAEDALDRRDALLDALRALAADHPDDAAVRENLAMGLYNTLNHAKAEDALDRRDALLDALRALAADHPDDAAVREKLAMGLYNTLNHAKAEDALDRRDALLDALRALAADHPDDAAVREQLAMGLYNTLNHAKAEDALDRRDALLDALRALAADHPDDAAMREQLAMGLFATLNHAKAEDALDRRDALLDALRALAADHPDDAAVREQLAMGLFATLNHAKAEDALDRRDALLDALRALAADHPDDAAVREQLAMGLFATLNHAKAEDALDRRDALLDALRALAADHPDDAAVREQLAMGLLNTLNHAKAEDALDRRDALLDALRALAADHPDDAAVREQLAMGLYNTLNHAKAEDALDRRDALLDALRALAADHPDDAAMREKLAMGLFNTLNDAKAEDALDRRDALLDALRALAADHPDDAAVREQLAMGLLNTLNHAKAEDALDRRDALLDALRALAADHPDDAAVAGWLARGLLKTGMDYENEFDPETALAKQEERVAEIVGLAAAHPTDPFLCELIRMLRGGAET